MASAAESIVFLLLDLARPIRRTFEAGLDSAGIGVTAGEARTLLFTSRHPDLRQAALAEKLGLDPMSLVALLDRLEAAELVTRIADPGDRRAKLIRATAAARPLIERIEVIAGSIEETALSGVGEGEAKTIGDVLARMRSTLSGGKGPAE